MSSPSYTEAEAAGKWCPFVRLKAPTPNRCFQSVSDQVQVVNRQRNEDLDALHPDCVCIASKCMAWRWTLTPSAALALIPAGTATGRCGMAD